MVCRLLSILLLQLLCLNLMAQQAVKGKVYDEQTKEPLEKVTILNIATGELVLSLADGSFTISSKGNQLKITAVGYEEKLIGIEADYMLVALLQKNDNLETVVVTASREAQKRSEAPVAIARVSQQLINNTKAATLNELVSKVPGVFMMRYAGEGHNMSIRQPLSTTAYFLYMEDGIPVRPMGLFNHNTLIETNIRAVNSIEVVRGPVSSLYGPEAVGGAINLISKRPTVVPQFGVGYQGDQFNFNQLEFHGSGTVNNKLGIFVGGFIGGQKNGWRERSDYDKTSINLKLEYKLSGISQLTLASSYNKYYVQEGLSFDSTAFYSKTYEASNDFMYRDISALRTRLTYSLQGKNNSDLFVTAYHRYNDYRQSPNHTVRWVQGSNTATSENQKALFNSVGLIAQFTKKWNWKNAKLILGSSHDHTPTDYDSYQIELNPELRPDGLSVKKYRYVRDRKDIAMGKYAADIYNTAVYAQFDMDLLDKLKLVAGGRFDHFSFDYENFLDNNLGSKVYSNITPKLGFTYNLGSGKGVYANYSVGFSPPGLTAIFRKRPVSSPGEAPFYYNLTPARFYNAEIGGWVSLFQNKLSADISLYHLTGRNELLSIRMPDNSTDYRSAGKTSHKGIELGVNYIPGTQWQVRLGGAYAIHKYDDFLLSERATDPLKVLDGKEMPAAPRLIMNTEIFYFPNWLKGFRVSAEWQLLTPWYLNQINSVKYNDKGFLGAKGVSILNVRMGYEWKGLEVFLNILNASNELYAYNVSRGNGATDRINYSPAAPATIGFGIYYKFTAK